MIADFKKSIEALDSNFDSLEPTESSWKIGGLILSNYYNATSRKNKLGERPQRRVRFEPVLVDTTPEITQSSPHKHAKSRVSRYVALSS